MNSTVAAWLARLKAWYEGLETRRRRNLLIATLFLIVTILLLSVFLLNPNYEVVFSGLSAKSAGQITQKLSSMKIPYQLQGNSILVPAAQADKARIDMAMNGLPSTGYVDYSQIFQQSNTFGMTNQELNLQVLDVLQQRIAQSIESINGISSAQVNIVMPTSQSFLQPVQTSGAKAAVMLSISPGTQLLPSQIAGIQELVAHAVQGLSPQNVTVVDQNGTDLSVDPSAPGLLGGAGASTLAADVALRQQIEQSLQNQLLGSLGQMVGPGNVTVIVHAAVTFNRKTTQSHLVQAGPPLSAQAQSSSSTGGLGAGGIAGQATKNPNIVTYGTTGAGAGATSSRSSTTNYDNSYTNTSTTFDPVQIQGYTVSVLLNSKVLRLTPLLYKQIQSYVLTAIGQRGTTALAPTVTVLSAPFATQAGVALAPQNWLTSPLGLGALAALLAAGGAVIFVARSRSRRRVTAEAIGSLSAASLASSPPESQELSIAKQLQELSHRRPESFASLLRTWLSDE